MSLVLIGVASLLGMHNVAIVTGAALETELAVYILACVAATVPFARSLDPRALVMVPGVMAAYHLAYGLGFLIGVLQPTGRRSGATSPTGFFTALTR